MVIFCADSTLWFTARVASGCGLFTNGNNVYRNVNNRRVAYAEYVGSRTIIGYILMQMV